MCEGVGGCGRQVGALWPEGFLSGCGSIHVNSFFSTSKRQKIPPVLLQSPLKQLCLCGVIQPCSWAILARWFTAELAALIKGFAPGITQPSLKVECRSEVSGHHENPF